MQPTPACLAIRQWLGLCLLRRALRFLVACALVDPQKPGRSGSFFSKEEVEDKAFARRLIETTSNRDRGLGVDLDEHIRFVLMLYDQCRKQIGLNNGPVK